MQRFGFDFGTTNSSLAWARADGQITLCPIDLPALNPQVLRSLLYFSIEQRGFVVGHRAISEYLAEDMQGRMMQSIKTFLADDSFEQTWVYDRYFTLEDLIAVVFRHVRAAIATMTSDDVALVIGRPAVFTDRRDKEETAQNRLRRAAQLANFFDIEFQYEPIAAGLSYEASLTQPETALIADFGGGTSDFTVMRLGTCRTLLPAASQRRAEPPKGHGPNLRRPQARREDILATGGVQVAGDSFSARIMEEKLTPYFGAGTTYRSIQGQDLTFPSQLLAKLARWHHVAFLRGRETRELLRRLRSTCSDPHAVAALEALVEGNYAFYLFQAIEQAKSELSAAEEAVLRFHRDVIDIEEPITRREFEQMIAPDLERIWQCMDTVLRKAHLGSEDIDAVFLTGGTAQMPIIRRLFAAEFGADKLKSQDYLTSVAVGLGLTALRQPVQL